MKTPRIDNVERERKLKRISPKGGSQGQRVYDSDGLSICLNACGLNDWYLVKGYEKNG